MAPIISKSKFRKTKKSVKKEVTNLEKRVSKIENADELKYCSVRYDITPSPVLSGAPRSICIFKSDSTTLAPARGTAVDQRVGKSITVTSVTWTMTVYSPNAVALAANGTNVVAYNSSGVVTTTAPVAAVWNPTDNRAVFRVIFVKEKGVSLGDGAYVEYIEQDGSAQYYPSYMYNRKEFDHQVTKVLFDKRYEWSSSDRSSGTHVIGGKLKFPGGIKVSFDDVNVSNDRNGIFMLIYSDIGNSVNKYDLYPQWQINYRDS